VDNGKFPAHLVATHRRLRAVDVLAYKTRRDARLAGADAVAEADVAAGVPYRCFTASRPSLLLMLDARLLYPPSPRWLCNRKNCVQFVPHRKTPTATRT
jgi:hypothetical protein